MKLAGSADRKAGYCRKKLVRVKSIINKGQTEDTDQPNKINEMRRIAADQNQ